MALFSWLTDSSFLDYSLTSITVAVGSTIGLLYAFQTKIIYVPHFPAGARTVVWKPSRFGFLPKNDEEIFIKTPDGVTIHGYFLSDDTKKDDDLPTFIYFQGNAGNIGHRLPILWRLHEVVPCNTFIVSYRGFGKSEGVPDESGIRIDAQAALDYVLSRSDVNPNRIILFGQSIGGAVAFDLAARNQSKIFAVILENTFLSLGKLIPHVLPWIGWASALCHQKWDSESRLAEMVAAAKEGDANFPHFLFLAGAKDKLVPPSHMKALYKMASEANASTVQYAGCSSGDHVDTCVQPEYYPAIQAFIEKICKQ